MPSGMVEYLILAALLGGARIAEILGRPAIDLQGSHLRVWSTAPEVSFNQWEASATLKVGWRF